MENGEQIFFITLNCPHETWQNNVIGRNHLLLGFFFSFSTTTGHFFRIPLPFKDNPPWLFHTDTEWRDLGHKVEKPYLTEKSTFFVLFFFLHMYNFQHKEVRLFISYQSQTCTTGRLFIKYLSTNLVYLFLFMLYLYLQRTELLRNLSYHIFYK